MHPRGPTALQSTVSGGVVTSVAKRRPDRLVPLELDAIVSAMVAMDPTIRPNARKVAERVEAYLDGDRDVARRRTMAVDLVWSARAAHNEGRTAEAMSASWSSARSRPPEYIRRGCRARQLRDPDPRRSSRRADSPGRARRARARRGIRRHARGAIFAYLALASFLPIAIWNGVLRWDIVLGVFGSAIVMAGAAWRIYRKPARTLTQMIVYAIGNALLVIAMARLAGPFTFVPALACAILIMSSMAYPPFVVRPWLLVTIIGARVLDPDLPRCSVAS